MVGLGYRQKMFNWDMSKVKADFFEVAPENWVHKDLSPLLALQDSGFPVYLHGVSLNLGGSAPINLSFVQDIRQLIDTLDASMYSDHMAATGDKYNLYDLFPVSFTIAEIHRVAERIDQVQNILGRQIAIENTTWYTNIGDMSEVDFLTELLQYADCKLLLDINNLDVNFKNHGGLRPEQFIEKIDLMRVSYIHVAGHEYDDRFNLYLDTHSQPVNDSTKELARALQSKYGIPILLEWDNDIPTMNSINRELLCLQSSMITSEA